VPDEVVVVVAGGGPLGPRAAFAAPRGVPVIAADSGLDNALALGLEVSVAIGDFDSASAAAVAAAEGAGTRFERHPREKDASDLELALEAAAGRHPDGILVLAPGGGRLDHLVSTLLLLAAERFASSRIDALVGEAWAHVVRGTREIEGEAGGLVTLLAVHGEAEGVTTEGLVYPLRGETLAPGSTRGVSNRFDNDRARVTVERGVVLAIVPGERE
jgi:thiamine pyrophosphokinase